MALFESLKKRLHAKVVEQLDPETLRLLSAEGGREEALAVIRELIKRESLPLSSAECEVIAREFLDEMIGAEGTIGTPEEPSRPRAWLPLVTLAIGILTGSLAGAIFTWWVNRPKDSIVGFRISTTTLAAREATSLIPGLKVVVGQEQVTALYAHKIEFSARADTYVDRLEVGLDFSSASRIYGVVGKEAPSKLHSIECRQDQELYRCALAPISYKDQSPYSITVATDNSDRPLVLSTQKGIELAQDDQGPRLSPETRLSAQLLGATASLIAGIAVVLSLVAAWSIWLRRALGQG